LAEVREYLKDAIRYSPGDDEIDWFTGDMLLIASGRKTLYRKWVTVFANEERASTVFEEASVVDELFTLGKKCKASARKLKFSIGWQFAALFHL
jgi:hypothetical protein